MNRGLTMVYALIALVEISAEFFDAANIRYSTKPFLMPILIAAYIQSVGKLNSIDKTLITAFFFSWIGDVALMLVSTNENFFLAGLGGFLITHVLYIYAFVKIADQNTPLLKSKPLVAAPLVAYFVALIFWIFPPIPTEMKAPVLVYSLTIALMVLTAMNNFGRVPRATFLNCFTGAMLFMLSDSIIAINKFVQPIAYAGVFIMVLYISAQYFIAKGFVALKKS